ncbi:MAG: SDR family oxidoreductase [Solirubrobacteraceae bacterium]|nr:SDR family oxidoreductase [Solirubrobacteraceae bacterium]
MNAPRTTAQNTTQGSCALVTGGSRGIGAATVEALAGQGWTVAFTARSIGDDAQALTARVQAAGGIAEGHAVDSADRAATDALIADLTERHGGIGVLVVNAGAELIDLIPTTADEDWDRLIELDLTSAFRLVRGVAMGMARRRWGRIVLVTSAVTEVVPAGQAAYTSAKWGLEGLARTAAVEFGKRGVTTNCVAPGIIDTAMTRRYEGQFDERAVAAAIPANRLGQPADVAAAIAYLVSDGAAYVNGTTLRVDGGLSVGARAFPA